MTMKKVLVAVAWPYVNGDIHVGHLAGYLLPADVFARYSRIKGYDVLMVSGSDCHGTPITVQAEKEKISPKEVVKKYHKKDIELFELYDLDYNLYTKTTTETHKNVVQDLFIDLLNNEYIIKDTMKQYYSPKDDEFLPDRYVEGTCLYCKAAEQRSDQCESCGRWLKEGELINPVSKKTGEKVELKDSEHYFLDFQKLEKELEDYLDGKVDGEDKKEIWRNWVYKEAKGWLKEGMNKRAITRDINWGIELPVDRIPQDKLVENIENKRIYVWFEAVIGYLSAPQEWSLYAKEMTDQKQVTNDYIFRKYKGQSDDWKEWWLDKTSRHYYFMGQDNLVFHTLMWPGELIGSQKGYTLPYNVVVNKFMNLNNGKFSKSRGNVIDSKEIAEAFGTDAVRYFILSNLPENKESNFTWERFKEANNNELVANLGNFINRTLVFYSRYFSQYEKEIRLSELSVSDIKFESETSAVLDQVRDHFDYMQKYLAECRFVEAIKELMEISRIGNYRFDMFKLWLKVKEKNYYHDYETVSGMFLLLNIVEYLRLGMRPFLPDAYDRLTKMLGFKEKEVQVGRDLFELNPIIALENVNNVKPLFKKIEDEDIEKFVKVDEKESLKLSKEEIAKLLAPIKIVKIINIEKHPDADRLLLVTITDGNSENVIVTGASNVEVGQYVPYLSEGNVVPGWLINDGKEIRLEKKAIRGVESSGMILACDEIGISDDHDGIYIIKADENALGKSILEVLEKDTLAKVRV